MITIVRKKAPDDWRHNTDHRGQVKVRYYEYHKTCGAIFCPAKMTHYGRSCSKCDIDGFSLAEGEAIAEFLNAVMIGAAPVHPHISIDITIRNNPPTRDEQ